MVLVRSRCGLSSTFDQCAASEHAVDDRDPVHHRSRGTIPFGHHEDVASAQRIDSSLEPWPALEGFGRHLLREDLVASLGAQRTELAVQVPGRGADPGVADLAHLPLAIRAGIVGQRKHRNHADSQQWLTSRNFDPPWPFTVRQLSG